MKLVRLALLLLGILLSGLGPAAAETKQCYDVLGVAMYCNRFLQAPKLPVMSTLMNTFGDPLPCVRRRAALGGLQAVQVDLIDATCWRNRSCPPGVPRPDDLRVIEKRAQQVQPLAAEFPGTEFWVSPALEHDEKDCPRVVKMLEAAQRGCPRCKVVNSPFSGCQPAGWKVERHGTTSKARGYWNSADGASSFDGDAMSSDGNDFLATELGEYATCVWWPELNLRCTGEEHPPAPKLRTEKPTADQFEQAYALSRPEPARPAARPPACKTVREVQPKRETYKPNAESYCNGQKPDPRGNKPLLIIRKAGAKGQRLKVLRPDGAEVGCFAYYGTYGPMPGTHRWYMGDCSGETPARLMRELGGEWGFVTLGRGECLLLNAVRRQGTYR